jgi:hypothetical protein
MKKVIYIAIALTLIGFIPVVHQELAGCSVFGDYLVSSTVVTTADSCATSMLAIPLIPSLQLSRLFPLGSAYLGYAFIGITSILIYTLIGGLLIRIKSAKIGN